MFGIREFILDKNNSLEDLVSLLEGGRVKPALLSEILPLSRGSKLESLGKNQSFSNKKVYETLKLLLEYDGAVVLTNESTTSYSPPVEILELLLQYGCCTSWFIRATIESGDAQKIKLLLGYIPGDQIATISLSLTPHSGLSQIEMLSLKELWCRGKFHHSLYRHIARDPEVFDNIMLEVKEGGYKVQSKFPTKSYKAEDTNSLSEDDFGFGICFGDEGASDNEVSGGKVGVKKPVALSLSKEGVNNKSTMGVIGEKLLSNMVKKVVALSLKSEAKLRSDAFGEKVSIDDVLLSLYQESHPSENMHPVLGDIYQEKLQAQIDYFVNTGEIAGDTLSNWLGLNDCDLTFEEAPSGLPEFSG